MKTYEFYQLDVFTDSKFRGNPLAVFPEANGISDEEMQKIAAEMNLSETVFVLPSERALRKLRIFTPKQELPLAGHPIVGTWNLLAQLGIVRKKETGAATIKQELNLGVLPVQIEFRQGKVYQVTMTQGDFSPGAIIDNDADVAQIAEGLGISKEDIANSENLPIQVVSTGIGSVAVPISNLKAIENCSINSSALSKIYLKHKAVGVFAFTFETLEESSRVHARFFAPADGIPEDPATGSAAGSFSGYAVYHSAIDTKRFVIEQGDFMNRPSRINAYVDGERGEIRTVRIGGKSVIVAKGEIYLD